MLWMMRLELAARLPFNFQATVRSHGWRRLAPFSWDGERLGRVERLSTGRVVKLAVGGSDELTGVIVDIRANDALSDREVGEIEGKVSWMLRLEEELTGFYRLCEGEPALRHVVEEGKGRILRSPTVYEDVVKTICTTNCTWRQTEGMVSRLVERLGEPYPVEPLRAFPTPEAVAEAGEDYLQEIKLGYRASSIAQLSHQVVSGDLDLEGLKGSSLETAELYKRLKSIKGVGQYAAAHILALLGRYDYLGVDTWARKLVSERFFDGAPVTDREVQEVFAPWGKWRFLAYWFWDWEG